jgi:senataxin
MSNGADRIVHDDDEKKNLRLFQEKILTLDFYKDIVDDQKIKKELTMVPVHFDSEAHYVDIFMTLFMEEVKMQIHRCKFTEMNPESEEVSLEKFKKDGKALKLELRRTISKAELSVRQFSIADLLLLSQAKDPMEETPMHMLAMVDHSVFHNLTAFVVLGDLKGGKGSRDMQISQAIRDEKTWHLTKVCGMATVIREFEGLMALKRIPLRSIIVNKQGQPPTKVNAEMQAAPPVAGINEDGGAGADVANSKGVPAPVKDSTEQLALPQVVHKIFETKYNESQLKAIDASRKVSGITLVQGPPGTGKTTTILGILSMLLNASASVAKSVSYTRTAKRDRNSIDAQLASESEEELEPEEMIQKRKRQRISLMRSRAAWYNGGFVPWADQLEQQLPGRDLGAVSVSYPKISSSSIIPMSEIREEQRPQKVLVCAPSNAAIDEVLRRSVKEGIVSEEGVVRKPAIVRVGPNLHSSLQDYSLEMQARKKVGAIGERKNVNVYEEEKARIMTSSQIVCTTLSISGSRDLTGFPEDFDTVVIDEASQGVELSTLVPLKLGCRRLILVGDPQQLPATCFSAVALAHNYERSLFQRLEASDHQVTMLVEQFRMHPAISSFPSKNFYDGKLVNARDEEEFEKKFPAPWSKINCFAPVVFFHMKGSQRKSAQSFINLEEAEFVVQLYHALTQLYPPEKPWRSRFAAISPYAEQVQLIRAKFRELLGLSSKAPCPVDVNTVDGFQGREKDIVIVSAVRANEQENTIGFVRDKRRMNVAFTRARLNLWVVGHASVLRKNPDWKAFIQAQQETSHLLRVSAPFNTFLATYLKGWYDRHPDVERPKTAFLDESLENKQQLTDEVPAESMGGELSDVEVEDIDEFKQLDEEVVSDADIDDVFDGAASDAEETLAQDGGQDFANEPAGVAQAPDDEDGEVVEA